MDILLDTSTLLFALGEPERLSDRARDTIDDRDSTLVVSAASAWEVATKVRIGKLPGGDYYLRRWESVLDDLGARQLPVTHEHGIWAGGLTWRHKDPFDRMIAAQAMIERTPLVSGDPAFAELPGLNTIW